MSRNSEPTTSGSTSYSVFHDGHTNPSGPEAGRKDASAGQNNKPSAIQRKRKAIDLNYCEYNLSTMKDSRGGFLFEEQPTGEAAEPKKAKVVSDPPINLMMNESSLCETCQSIDLDPHYLKHFGVHVCKSCKDEHTEKYSLLTKTECRQDYLLTESELRDAKRLPHWIKPNPHKSTYSNMLLYLRKQVEEFAWDKWGSPEALDKTFEDREQVKKERKEKKWKAKVSELRRKTRTSTWQRDVNEKHEHVYGEPIHLPETDEYQITCDCGMTSTYEAF
ncbi:XPA protein C-terminus-domain-containing protein [Phlyctochytrium arcticum]|nr:XPA protein C-terminus-domain-containing protein [Phlyctochytrium arcticum]